MSICKYVFAHGIIVKWQTVFADRIAHNDSDSIIFYTRVSFRERVESLTWIVALGFHHPRVDHVFDAGDGDGGFGDVRGQNHLPGSL